MIFVLLFFGGLAYLHFGVKKQTPTGNTGSSRERTVNSQPISWQASQGFAQGDEQSSGRGKRYTEGNRAVAQPQSGIKKGVAGNAGTQRVLADLQDRISSTFDPQWKMRYMNAYHRMVLQDDVDNGRAPRASLNVDRTSLEVNDDTGHTSGFTRTQITYQDRFRRGRAAPGMGPNATRALDQEDPGDQTSMQTATKPNGHKSIIYPSSTHDRDGIKEPWAGLQVVNLERDYWSKDGRSYNPVGSTNTDMPANKGWNWWGIIPKRGKHGAYPSNRQLPSRSNRHDDSVNSGGGIG